MSTKLWERLDEAMLLNKMKLGKKWILIPLASAIGLPIAMTLACGTATEETSQPEASLAATSTSQRTDSDLGPFRDWFDNAATFKAKTETLNAESIASISTNKEYQEFATWLSNAPGGADKASYIEKILNLPLTTEQKQYVFAKHIAQFEKLPHPEWAPGASQSSTIETLSAWAKNLKALETKVATFSEATRAAVQKSTASILAILEMHEKIYVNFSIDPDMIVKKMVSLPIPLEQKEEVLYLVLSQIRPRNSQDVLTPLTTEALATRKTELTAFVEQLKQNSAEKAKWLAQSDDNKWLRLRSNAYQDFITWAQSVWAKERTNETLFIEKAASSANQYNEQKYILAFYLDNKDKSAITWPQTNPITY